MHASKWSIHPLIVVELVGFEPTSAQGNHVLSTRLFRPLIFVRQQDPDHQLPPYPLKIHPRSGASADYFRFNLHRWIFGFGTTSSERCLVASPCDAIKPVTYCTSVRQRERNCFRQLIFVHSDLGASQRGSACLHIISTCRQIRSTP